MPMIHARRFILKALTDSGLRSLLNQAGDHAARAAVLFDAGYDFSQLEFDEAMRSLEVTCQSLEHHQQLQELRLWWEMLRND